MLLINIDIGYDLYLIDKTIQVKPPVYLVFSSILCKFKNLNIKLIKKNSLKDKDTNLKKFFFLLQL